MCPPKYTILYGMTAKQQIHSMVPWACCHARTGFNSPPPFRHAIIQSMKIDNKAWGKNYSNLDKISVSWLQPCNPLVLIQLLGCPRFWREISLPGGTKNHSVVNPAPTQTPSLPQFRDSSATFAACSLEPRVPSVVVGSSTSVHS